MAYALRLLVLSVISLSLVAVGIIFMFTPTSIFPGSGVGSPPVDIVKELSGIRCYYSGCYYYVSVINRSNQEQKIVALVKSSADSSPCRSATITLGPHESSVVLISPSVQPSLPTGSMGTIEYQSEWSAAVEPWTRWDYLGVEYAEGSLPSGSGSPQTFGANLYWYHVFGIISFAVGLALFGVAYKMMGRAKPLGSYSSKVWRASTT